MAVQPNVPETELVQEIQKILPLPRRSRCPRAGGRGRRGHERVHHLPPGLPARLRRHRALRRQLRDRELALDHDRAAHARVRDDPDPRRLSAAGARFDRDRGSRRWNAGLDRRPLLRPRARKGALQALRRGRFHTSEPGTPARDPDDRRLAARRHPGHAPGQPPAGDPGDARAADRRSARRRDPARVPLRPLPHGRLTRVDRNRLRRTRVRTVRKRPRHDADPALDGYRSAADLHRRRALLRTARAAAGARGARSSAGSSRCGSAAPLDCSQGTTPAATRSARPRRPRR